MPLAPRAPTPAAAVVVVLSGEEEETPRLADEAAVETFDELLLDALEDEVAEEFGAAVAAVPSDLDDSAWSLSLPSSRKQMMLLSDQMCSFPLPPPLPLMSR